MGGLREWSREEVASRILAGDTLIVYNKQVIRVSPSWLSAHPGGELAILHFVGRDATDEIQAFHSEETLRRMKGFIIGHVETCEEGWHPLLPPVESGWVRKMGTSGSLEWHQEAVAVRSKGDSQYSPSSQILLVQKDTFSDAQTCPTLEDVTPPPTKLSLNIQTQHSEAYKALHREIVDAGLYKTPYLTGYGPEVVRYLLLAVLAAITYNKGWYIPSAVCVGLFWHQVAFTVHDLGHNGVTHNWWIDRVTAVLIASYMGGCSALWWVDNHNVHHLVTNHPSHDPDIQHVPFFAICPHFLTSLYSSYYKRIMVFDRAARIFLSVQHKLFYVVMALARFNLYANSYTYLAKTAFQAPRVYGGKWIWCLEVFGVIFFWTWYGYLLKSLGSWQWAIVYLLVSHVVASPLHVQIVLSHFSRSTADLGPTESFPDRQLRTTTDVICPEHLAFVHGGLHLQVTHHLFPRLPRHNLKPASMLVKKFAKENGLEYAEFGFIQGNGEVRNVLKNVAHQVKLVHMVADNEVQEVLERLNQE